jgi:hypothetical protein
MDKNVMFSSKDMTWETPQELFDSLNKELNPAPFPSMIVVFKK